MLGRNHIVFRKVTIVGVGLIGGSIGMAIKKHSLAKEIVGVSQRQASLVEAIKNQAIDTGLTEIDAAVRNADLVILAAPVETIITLLPVINPHVRRGCIVTDVGSAKMNIVDVAEKKLTVPSFFVGSHPLAGSEKQGVQHARAELFENSLCIMTPTASTNPMVKEKVKHFWTKIGANVHFMSPEEHDGMVSYISHLPHLLAYGLIETIPPQFLEFAAQGLKDTTRIAGSAPNMWKDICLANSKNVIKALDDYIKQASILRKAIRQQDANTLLNYFTKAKDKRDKLDSSQPIQAAQAPQPNQPTQTQTPSSPQ